MTVRAELHLINNGAEKIIPLDAPRSTVGRAPENTLPLRHPSVSRQHAEFIRLGSDLVLRDLGSTNGCFVNGVRASEQLLNDGDVIRFGPAGPELRFRLITDGRHSRWATTENLIESLSNRIASTPADTCEDANLRCLLAEAHLNRGHNEEALALLTKYADPTQLLALPIGLRAAVLLWLGRTHIERKEYDLAVEVLERSINLADQEGEENALIEAQASLGRALIGRDDRFGARDSLQRALLISRRAGNARLAAEVHLWLGKLDWKDGDFDGARYNWMRATRLVEGLNAPLLLARVQLQQAFVLYAEGKTRESVPLFESAIERLQAIGNVRLLLKGFSHVSRAHMRLGAWSNVRRLLDDRLSLARRQGLTKEEAVALTDLAEIELLQGHLAPATEAIELAVELHRPRVYARTQRILGRLLVVRGQTRQGIRELEHGLDAARRGGALEEQILNGLELALAYLTLNQVDEARARLEEAETTTPLDPALTLMGRALYVRGNYHLALGQLPEANRSFTQSRDVFQRTGDPYRTGLCEFAIGDLRLRMDRAPSARAHFEEAQRIFTRLGATAELRRVEARLATSAFDAVKPEMTALTTRLSRTARLSMEHLTRSLNEPTSHEPKMPRILVAVGNDELAALLGRGLEVENYVITRVSDGRTAYEYAMKRKSHYVLLLLDALLEHRSGFDICRELRKSMVQTPVILLGSRQGIEDKIEALQSGADDFLSKRGLVFEELLAKIDALLR